DDNGGNYFVFRRTTKRQPDGATRVEEERKYWSQFEVVRWTRRSATFSAGAEPNMTKVPMTMRSLINLSGDDRRSDQLTEAAEKVYAEARAFPPEHDPAAGADAEWQRVKLIKGTLSPNGRYQLAWGPNEKVIDWSKFADEQAGDFMSDTETNLTNYIADLETHRIAGRTLGVHFGTRHRYNHRDCDVAWSPDSTFFAELTTDKWEYTGFCAGQVKDGKVTGCVDLAKPAIAAAGKFLVAKKDGAWRKHHGKLDIQFGDVEVADNGAIAFKMYGQIPKSDLPDDNLELLGHLRLTASQKGLQLVPSGFAYPHRGD
ncbi:MAG TPA: hypothetical protein VEO95_04460, partial [Chthoniobacteraceae bacterium]|nr:hypothetical protein [Chthoniobacteraceae bacterium]